jgi:hypothetical protein
MSVSPPVVLQDNLSPQLRNDGVHSQHTVHHLPFVQYCRYWARKVYVTIFATESEFWHSETMLMGFSTEKILLTA